MIAIIAAMKDEVKDILSKLELDEVVHIKPSIIYHGKYKGHEIALMVSGIGYEAMHKATVYLLDNFNPSVCLHIGYAGGTDPLLQVGDLIIASELREKDKDKIFVTDDLLKKKAVEICIRENLRYKEGVVVTVAEPLNTPHEKAFLGTQYESLAIDMESSAFAEVATFHKIPFVVARAIFDPLDMPLPALSDTITTDGDINKFELARHVYHNPKDLLNLPKFAYCANKAREVMTKFIDFWLDGTH